MGVIRKHKTVSGLIKYQPRGEPADWAAAAKGILATEKPDAIVVMLGLNDRVAIREAVTEKKTDKKDDKKDARAKPDAKRASGRSRADAAKPDAGKARSKPRPTPPPRPMPTNRPMPRTGRRCRRRCAADRCPGKDARSGGGLYEFPRRALGRTLREEDRRDDRRAEVQGRAGAVGRPARDPRPKGERPTCCSWMRCIAMRPARPASPMSMSGTALSMKPAASCRRVRTSKARSASCAPTTACIFTKAGARKLAHYVEREVTRLLAARSGPIALPIEPATPDANAVPGQPAPRPLAGPILPLVASSVGTDQLLGGPGSRPAAVDALAARTLVKGEALAPPAGRADDFAWPRREIGREQAKGDTPVAADIAERNGGGGARTEAAVASAAAAQRYNNRRGSRRPRPADLGRRRTTVRRCAISSAASAPRRASQRHRPAAPPRGPASPERAAPAG